jgi:hypothetical protein
MISWSTGFSILASWCPSLSVSQSELAAAREAQKAAKLKQRAEIARVEHDEFMRVLAVNRAKEAEEMAMSATQVCDMSEQHRREN